MSPFSQGARVDGYFVMGTIEALKVLHTGFVFGFDTVWQGQACAAAIKMLTTKGCPTKHAVLFSIDLEKESLDKPTKWKAVRNDQDEPVRGRMPLMLSPSAYTWTLFERVTEHDDDADIMVDPLLETAWKLVCSDGDRRAALEKHHLAMTTRRELEQRTCMNLSCNATFFLPVGTATDPVVCNQCKKTSTTGGSRSSGRNSVLNTTAASGSKQAAANKASAVKEKSTEYFSPRPHELNSTHLTASDEKNPIGVATSISASLLFISPSPGVLKLLGLTVIPLLKQEMNAGGMYSPGVIVDGSPMLGPMKIVSFDGVDINELRHLPSKVFDNGGTATLVGFITKASDKTPKPLFIEYRDGKVCGLTHLKDPAASKWLKNTQLSMAWNNTVTSSAFDHTEEALMISLLTVDTNILKGLFVLLLFLFIFYICLTFSFLSPRCAHPGATTCPQDQQSR